MTDVASKALAEGKNVVAIDLYHDALWWREGDDLELERSIYIGLAATHFALNEFDLATLAYREALQVSDGMADKAEVLFRQAGMLSELRWYFPAINLYEKSLGYLVQSPKNELSEVLGEMIKGRLNQAKEGLDEQSKTWPFRYHNGYGSKPYEVLEDGIDERLEASG